MRDSFNLDSKLAGRPFERILLIKPSSLGDVTHALPVLNGLRRRYPHARIEWLVAAPFAPLLEGHPALDAVVRFDRRRFGKMWRSPRVAWDFFRFLRELRAGQYDLVIDLQGLFRSGFLAWVTGAGVRIGFRHARELAPWFYTYQLPAEGPDLHAVDRCYRVATLLGFADTPIEFPLPIPAAAHRAADDLLAEADLRDVECLVGVAPGARWETKRWGAQRFASLIDALHRQPGVRVVLLGSAEEAVLGREVAANCQTSPVDLTGRTGVATLAAMIERCALIIAHDSAVMHLAVAQRRPLVCIVGPTNPRRTGPYRRLDDVVRLDLDCSPCYLRRLAQCPYDHRCMKELSVAAVLEKAERALPRLAVHA